MSSATETAAIGTDASDLVRADAFIVHQLGAQDGLCVLVASGRLRDLLDLGDGGAVTRYVAELRARGRSDEASASMRRYGCQRQPCCPNLSRSTSDQGHFKRLASGARDARSAPSCLPAGLCAVT
jgi:hypothetical protein